MFISEETEGHKVAFHGMEDLIDCFCTVSMEYERGIEYAEEVVTREKVGRLGTEGTSE